MATGTQITQLRIWREGGITGITRIATVTDSDLIVRIQAELTHVSIGRPARLPDMFQYVFEADGGTGDGSFRAERHLPENALPATLRSLLHDLSFDAVKTPR